MSANVERIGTMRCGVGESPVWRAADQSFWWTDIPGRTLWRWTPATDAIVSFALPEMAGSIAPMAGGGWLLAMETGMFALDEPVAPQAAPRLLASVEHAAPAMRFNDGRCDRQGRFWVGSMLLDMSADRGRLYRFDRDGLSAPVLDKLYVPNGLAFSPDGKTMYLSDSHPSQQQVWAFDYDTDTGTPSNRRVFVDMRDLPGRPDGAAVDVDGCYWVCGNDAGLVHRFTPDGKLDRSIEVPVAKPTMCAFGGDRLDMLFIASIRPGDSKPDSLAGAVFVAHPGVQGIEEPAFAD